MWGEAKEALLHQGHFELAGPLVNEAVAEADHWGRPLGRVSAYANRAAYRLEFGARQQALADLREAQHALSQMEESALKDQLAFITSITEGLLYEKTDPARSASLFQAALEGQGATDNLFEAITYTTEKAAAQLAAGDLPAGTASLEEAISIFEDIRTTVEDPVSRMQAFRQAQPAFDRLIGLRTTALAGDPEEAFLLAERSRARVLLELRTGNGSPAAREEDFVRLSDLEKVLPRKTALVSYAVLEDRVLAWVIEGGRARLVTLKIQRKDLARAIERFRLEMRRDAEERDLQKAAAPLYDSLIRPLALEPGSEGSLIIAPDRWLARLPFAALFDRKTGHYLIEERIVTIVPSATLLVKGSRARRIGNCPLSRSEFPGPVRSPEDFCAHCHMPKKKPRQLQKFINAHKSFSEPTRPKEISSCCPSQAMWFTSRGMRWWIWSRRAARFCCSAAHPALWSRCPSESCSMPGLAERVSWCFPPAGRRTVWWMTGRGCSELPVLFSRPVFPRSSRAPGT
jgi:CHAT domain-containing protein